MNEHLIGADEMARIDRELGIPEYCEECGALHWDKTPVCRDCDYIAKMADIMDAEVVVDEPLSWERF